MIHQQRVIVGDTDLMGIVYYASYFRYFEAARAAYLRLLGKNQQAVAEWGVSMPVIEAHCQYRKPAVNEDLLAIHTGLDQIRGASFRFVYEIKRDDEVITSGFTVHACTNAEGRPRRMPKMFRELISRAV